jgi:hypothetical protein
MIEDDNKLDTYIKFFKQSFEIEIFLSLTQVSFSSLEAHENINVSQGEVSINGMQTTSYSFDTVIVDQKTIACIGDYL